jgi:hypothetical protein
MSKPPEPVDYRLLIVLAILVTIALVILWDSLPRAWHATAHTSFAVAGLITACCWYAAFRAYRRQRRQGPRP